MITQLDQLLTHLGTGSWSILHFTALCYTGFLAAPHALQAAFVAPSLAFVCRLPQSLTVSSTLHSPTASPTNDSITPHTLLQDQCRYAVITTSGTTWEECTDWDFDNSTFASTVTSEFGLVCGRREVRTWYQSIYMIGMFLGALLTSLLCDKYGRKRVLAIGTYLFILVTVGTFWVHDLSMLLASRLLVGGMMCLVCSSSFVLAMEVAEPRVRTGLAFGSGVAWALGILAWGGLAYCIREWRTLHLAASLPALLLLPILMFIDESPRWLMVRGRHDEALKVLRRAARWNRVALPPQEELLHFMADMVPPTNAVRCSTSWLRSLVVRHLQEVTVLFRTPRLRSITVVLYMNYAVLTMVYYGLSLSGGSLSDDPFLYMVLTGLMEVPAYTLTIPIVDRVGRRPPTAAGFIFSGTMLMILAAIPTGYSRLVMTLAMLGKVSISAAFQVVILHCNELFPTQVRSRGFGTAEMMSRIGSICSPFIIDLLGGRYPWAPSVVFGVAAVVAGLASLTLPETRGATMPDTIDQLEGQPQKSSSSKYWLALRARVAQGQTKSGSTRKETSATYAP